MCADEQGSYIQRLANIFASMRMLVNPKEAPSVPPLQVVSKSLCSS